MDNGKKEFDDSWEEWLNLNIKRGCCKKELFQILLNNNYNYNFIKSKLHIDYVPKKSLNNINKNNENIKNFYNIKIKGSKKFDSNLIQLYTIDNFLNKEECDKIIFHTSQKLVKSEITNKNEKDKKFRTSSTCHITNLSGEALKYLKYIDNKICNKLGIPNKYSEGIQIQNYEVGQEFKLHTDFFNDGTDKKYYEKQGNRTWTFMVYLNNTKKGGATYLPKIKKRFYPKVGKALIWNNLNKNGEGNHNTLHSGEPILEGNKIIITKWFRQRIG